jgi:hypothetical protein
MKWWISILIILATVIVTGQAFAAGGPQVINLDGKISISADHITLGFLLHLWDQATGTKSAAPPELAKRKLSVHFTGLSEDEAVRAIFLGQPFGFAFARGQGIVVTSPSRVASSRPAPPMNDNGQYDANAGNVISPPDESDMQDVPEIQSQEIQRMKPQIAAPEQPVTVTPSPFGPIVGPEGSQPPFVQLPPVPNAPLPPPFFRPDVPANTPSGAPYGPGHDMLFSPLSIHP